MAERDENGRFIKGHSGNPTGAGAGRPKKVRELKFLDILVSTISDTDWRAVIRKALEMAKGGDIQAMKFLAGYAIGEPDKTVNLITNPKSYSEVLEEELERFRNIEGDNESESQQISQNG